MSDIHQQVRERYADAATAVAQGHDDATAFDSSSCCGSEANEGCCEDTTVFGPKLYASLESEKLPQEAVLASLGCGNPMAVADLRAGETVLDLGSGGGIDVLLSAKRVGASGKAYGLDMTDEMLALANTNKQQAGATNVEFVKGFIEEVPLPDRSVDVVISNCVINLAADKNAVFREMHRVLRPGGRVGVTDVVAADHLSASERAERGSYVGCIAGSLSFAEYKQGLIQAGFEEIDISPTHSVAEEMFSAIVKARKRDD